MPACASGAAHRGYGQGQRGPTRPCAPEPRLEGRRAATGLGLRPCGAGSRLDLRCSCGAARRAQGPRQFASAAPAQRGPAQSMACATQPPGGPTANPGSPIGFRTVARKLRTTAPMRGQQLRCASAGWRVRRSYNSPRLSGFRTGADRSRNRSTGRAWHGAKRGNLPRTFRKCRKTSTAQVYARWVLSVKREWRHLGAVPATPGGQGRSRPTGSLT